MRECGVLMHITSLPGPYGVGTMGKSAFEFVDFLEAAGQSWWQILPLSPTGYGDSPYQSASAYAGNPYVIDLDLLRQEGLVTQAELDSYFWCQSEEKVDYGALYQNRWSVLRLCYSRFTGGEAFDTFCRENEGWLPDFALFMALKNATFGQSWYNWEDGLKRRRPEALEKARSTYADEIRFQCFVQFQFARQWQALRSYAGSKGIRFIGDVPIYVPLDSVEVWSNPELFQLDEALVPTAVAGCPPDAFSEDGQLWGNPLYRWDVMQKDGYAWWLRRMAAAGKLYDVVRLDHFRGFEAYWAVPYGEDTAKNGKWVKGPDHDFIATLLRELPQLSLIAEDLGFLTSEVLALRDDFHLPGMKVLGFAFDSREPSEYLPHTYPENSVCYTGTHDNMTTRQWFETASKDAVQYAKEYMALTEEEGFVWGMIRTAYSSVSKLAIVPMQDFLELGAKSRMNFPGTLTDCNWTWRAKDGIISFDLAQRIQKLAILYGRKVVNNGETVSYI
ncbi:MAG: 4-alpha-glucanotransferase [Faecousia sp.]